MDRQPELSVESIPLCTLIDEVKRRGIIKLTVAPSGEIRFEYGVKNGKL